MNLLQLITNNLFHFTFADSHNPLFKIESIGSKVTVPGGLGTEKSYSFLSEINRYLTSYFIYIYIYIYTHTYVCLSVFICVCVLNIYTSLISYVNSINGLVPTATTNTFGIRWDSMNQPLHSFNKSI